MNKTLPPNWSWVKLGDVTEFIYGKGLIKGDRNIGGKFPVYGSNGIVGYHNEYLVEGPCIVVGRKGAAGEVHLSNKNCWPIDTTYYIKSSEEYSINYLYYILKNLRLASLDKSTAIPGLNRNDAYKLSIPLPPLSEQKKIVEKIEELFSGLDNGVSSLKKAKAQIRQYRQSVLASAFSGGLHQDSSDYMIYKIKEKNKSGKSLNPENPQILPNHGSDNLPDGWKWVKLGEVLEVKDGTHDTPKYHDKGIPFITQKNIKNGEFVFDNYSLISEEDHQKFYKRSNVAFNDIIISMIGANRGMSTIVKTNETFSIKNVGLVKTDESKFLAKYLAYFFKSEIGQGSILSQSKGGAQQFIGLTELRNWSVPFQPLNQQTQIVEEIEKRFSEADNLEKAIDDSLAKSELLRQSLLSQAFSGKLIR